MGRDGSRRREKTKHQQHHQESRYEHALEEQRREREDVLENFGVSGPTGRMIVGIVSIALFALGIVALLALITFR